MLELLHEILDPQFILRNSLYMGILIGAICPMVGVYLVMRRIVFLGVALPQVSSCGIALAFGLHSWSWLQKWMPHVEDENLLAFLGASALTSVVIVVLALLERGRRGSGEGRVGTVYALAGAWSILLLVKNPFGEHGLLERLKGEIIAVSNADLALAGICFGVVAALLLIFRKELLLASFDPDMALVLRKKVFVWDLFLFLLVGLVISVAVLSVGPLVTFGFLVLPPLIAYRVAANMSQLAWISSVLGGISAGVGFGVAYRWDLPLGPTDVALLGLLLGVAMLIPRRGRRPQLVGTVAGR